MKLQSSKKDDTVGFCTTRQPPYFPVIKNDNNLMNNSIESLKSELEKYLDKETIRKLDFNTLKYEKDLLSSIYEQLLKKQDRKRYAQFFTHTELVNFILTHIPINNQSLILDLSCGAGAFLIKAYNKTGGNLDNIFGIDIDEVAVELCKLNMQFVAQKVPKNIKKADTLKENIFENLFPDVAKNGGFDIVIGNPPFQNLKKNIDYYENESLYSQVLTGIANSATLMITKGYECLKDGGYLGFVLPKNILRVESFKGVRNFLINNTKLMYIYDVDHYFKDVRGDQIILVFQKERLKNEDLKKHKVTLLIYRKGSDFLHPHKYEVPQSEFLKYDFFPIFYHENMFSLADHLLKLKPTLNDVCNGNIFRGLSLSAKHNLISKNNSEGKAIVYRGDSIRRFGIKYPLYIDLKELNGLHKDKIKKLQTNKIVLQNICSREGGIFAALSKSNELSVDTITNVVPTKLNLKYLLGVLNSKITNFFIISVIFLDSNFTMHTDREYIGKIPIVLPTPKQEKQVVDIVEKILKIEDNYSKEFFEEYEKLNNILFDIYGIDQSHKELINEILNVVMSKKQNGKANE